MAENERDRIGGVSLDYKFYTGEDRYCDGIVEDDILDVVKNHEPSEYEDIIRYRRDWPTLYHLSSIRENIVRWIPMTRDDKVLEIGAGPGAVTGALAEACGEVVCVDLSRKRSLINACRHKTCDNIKIKVGNFQDYEPYLDKDFSYIFLIGVLEYAAAYLDSEDPYTEMIRLLQHHLKKGGRIVIAIENRLGLKYFAGCAEDHTGVYFDGIQNYPDPDNTIRTFTRNRLEKILHKAGCEEYSFYYPYPDYKFPEEIYSDRKLPRGSELTDNIRNFDRERLLLFNERAAYEGITEDELYPVFANSYEIVIGPKLPVTYCKFSNDRAPQYQIRTSFEEDPKEGTRVVKYPMTQKAREHVHRMLRMGGLLRERYDAAPPERKLNIAQCREKGDAADFELVSGRPLSGCLDEALFGKDPDLFFSLLEEYKTRTGWKDDQPVSDSDMTFDNILIDGDTWTAIDYEWASPERLPAREQLLRSIVCYFREDSRRKEKITGLCGLDTLYEKLDTSEAEMVHFEQLEDEFQEKVTGGRISLGMLRAQIGGDVIVPEQVRTSQQIEDARREEEERSRYDEQLRLEKEREALTAIHIYFDTGRGFNEQQSRILDERYGEEGIAVFTLHVPQDVKNLRVDPANCPCMALVRSVKIEDQEEKELFARYQTAGGRRSMEGDMLFITDDPNIVWNLVKIRRKLRKKSDLDITFELQMVGLPSTMAESLRKGQ